MQVKRAVLIEHLEKIACDGEITEAVFTGAFRTEALSPDQLLLVSAPPLERAEALENEIGLAELDKLIRSLRVISGAGNEADLVTLLVQDHRLVIPEAHRGTLRLMTANPATIGTRVEASSSEKLFGRSFEAGEIALSRVLLEGIRNTFALFKAEEVEFLLGPKGALIRVGNENADIAEFAVPELKTPKSYSLLFGKHIIRVFGVVKNYAEAKLKLAGPGLPILITDGEYKYLLSPRAQAA